MAVTATPVYVQAPKTYVGLIQNSTGAYTFAIGNTTTNLVSIVAGGTNGTKIDSLFATSTDTTARDIQLVLSNGTNSFVLGTVNVPITAGFTNAVPNVNLLKNAQLPGLGYDALGNPYLYIPSGFTLYAGSLVAVTAAKQVSVIAVGGDF